MKIIFAETVKYNDYTEFGNTKHHEGKCCVSIFMGHWVEEGLLLSNDEFLLITGGWGSQSKHWLDRKNPNINKGRLGILDECNWKISYTSLYREEQLVLLP